MKTQRKALSLLLCVSLLLGCLMTAGISVAAAETTWNDATVGQWAALTADSAILKETNLLTGIGATNGVTGTAFALGDDSAPIAVSTDGKLAVKNDGASYASYKIGRGANETPTWRKMTYDMGDFYAVQDFVVAACVDGSLYAPHHIRIYVSDSVDTLYNEGNLVIKAEKFDVTGNQWQFKAAEAVTGRFVGFEVYAPPWLGSDHVVTPENNPECYGDNGKLIYAEWYQLIRLGEIGVYGEKANKPETPTDVTWKDATVGQWASLTADSEILNETNLLTGIGATNGITGTAFALGDGSAPIAVSTDGKLAVKNDGASYASYKIGRGANETPTWRKLTYDLNGYYSVQDFVVAACVDGSLYAPHHIRIYVSNELETLYDAASLVVKAEKFDVTGNQWQFKAAEAVSGRYVGFEIYAPPWLGSDHVVTPENNPECYDANGKLIYAEWYQQIRLGEIGVYGELLESAPGYDYNYKIITSGNDIPAGNLLLGEAVENKTDTAGNPVDYLIPTDAGGGGISTAAESTIPSMTDGLITGINTNDKNGVGLNRVTSGGFMYDMRGKVEIEKLLVSAITDNDPNYRITYLEMYVADSVSELFAGEPVVRVELQSIPSQLVTLNEKVTGRYIGFKAPKIGIYDVVRIGELGIYGTYKEEPRPFDDNLILGRQPAESYLSFANEPARRMKATQIEFRGQEEYGDLPEHLTDGNVDNRAVIYALSGVGADPDWSYSNVNGGDGKKLEPNTPWIVLIYHLGGTCELSSITLTSSNEPGYYIAGAEFYASDKIATLFDEENRVLDTGGNTMCTNEKGAEVLDPAYDVKERAISCDLYGQNKTARYVAFVISRAHPANQKGYSMARFSELTVTGTMLEEDPVFDTALQTVTDKATGIIATLTRVNLDDVDFFDGLQLDVKVSSLPKSINKVFDNGWLRVDSDVYTLTLKDKNGRAYTPEEVGSRIWDIKIPKTNDEFQMAAVLADGELTRVRSSYSDPTEQYVKLGTAYGNESTIYGNGTQYVLVRYTTVEEQNALNNVLLSAPAEYQTESVNDSVTTAAVWPSMLLLAALAAVVMYIRRRRVNQ